LIVVCILTTGSEQRRPYVDALRRAIPGRIPCAVHLDDATGTPSHRRGYDAAWTAAHRLASRTRDATHALVLEDDAIPCSAFWPSVVHAVFAANLDRPRAVSFCCRRKQALYHHRATGSCWWQVNDWRNSEAVCLPVPWIPGYLAHVGTLAPQYGDVTLMEHLRERNEKMWFTIPSLVQHGLPSDSLLGNSRANRISPSFVDDPSNELSYPVDWRVGLPYYQPEEYA
jgi:hypothetical protein